MVFPLLDPFSLPMPSELTQISSGTASPAVLPMSLVTLSHSGLFTFTVALTIVCNCVLTYWFDLCLSLSR